MDSNVKKELIDEIQQLNIKNEEEKFIMPFNIVSAVLKLPNASEIDVDSKAISVSSSDVQLQSFLHSDDRYCTSQTIHNRPVLTLHDVSQTRTHEGSRITLGIFDLVLTFENQDDYFVFRQHISVEYGYRPRPPPQ